MTIRRFAFVCAIGLAANVMHWKSVVDKRHLLLVPHFMDSIVTIHPLQ